uniref:Uncharacterized protein n=1 Tax=viral metagenome TaxID=1070528 RepID=A0A6M3KXH8_9ZZZZ
MRTPEQEEQWQAMRERIAQVISFVDQAGFETLKKDFPICLAECYRKADTILSDPSIAVVDENQELPQNPWYDVTSGHWLGCDLAYRDMVNDNWWKVIPKE